MKIAVRCKLKFQGSLASSTCPTASYKILLWEPEREGAEPTFAAIEDLDVVKLKSREHNPPSQWGEINAKIVVHEVGIQEER